MTPATFNLILTVIAMTLLAIIFIIVKSMKLHGFKPYDGWTLMYDHGNQFLTRVWRAIPYRGQSVIIIGFWILISTVMIFTMIEDLKEFTDWDIPEVILVAVFVSLGIFYIVEEIRGNLRRRPDA